MLTAQLESVQDTNTLISFRVTAKAYCWVKKLLFSAAKCALTLDTARSSKHNPLGAKLIVEYTHTHT